MIRRRNAIIFFALTISLIIFSCARQTTPEGGPKDLIKPELIKSTPEENQKNFKGKSIELYFSEEIKLKDPKDEILITPSIGKEPKFTAIGNKILITPETPFIDSTTYNINFRESIQDITESNAAEELHIAFSTGPTIDSLTISGNIVDSKSELPPEKITVALFMSDTFNIFEHKTSYYTKSDKKGYFKISNLKKGNYYVYAFDDKNKNLKVESTNEKYGFTQNAINLDRNVDSIKLVLVNIDSRKIKLNSNRSNNKTTTLRFNKSITNYKAELETPILSSFGDNQTEVVFYHPEDPKKQDSIKLRLTATDSLEQSYDSTFYIKRGEAKAVKTTFSLSTQPPIIDYQTGTIKVLAKSNIPIAKFNYDSSYISLDSATTIRLKDEDISYDHQSKKFTIQTKIDTTILNKTSNEQTKSNSEKKRKENKEIVLGKGFALSIYNDSSKKQKIELPRKQETKTGSLTIETETKESHFIVELIDQTGITTQKASNFKKHTFPGLTGEFKIRIIKDANQNGKWDLGNIYRKIEPENITYYKSIEGKFSIPIRENWEVGPIKLKF